MNKLHSINSPSNPGNTHNILLIQCDQWNARCLSILGNPQVHTPNLDQLAQEGVLFEQARCNNPICLPSRISMLSGRYCTTTQQFGFTGECRSDIPWLQDVFHSSGYLTGAFGKFHVLSIGSNRWQYDVCAPTLPEEVDLARPAGNHYKAFCEQRGYPWPNDQIHGHVPQSLMGKSATPPSPFVFASDSDDSSPLIVRSSVRSDVPLAGSLETYTTSTCLDFLEQAKKKAKPFFAWLTYDRPHYPHTLPSEWFDRIAPDSLNLWPEPTDDDCRTMTPSLFTCYAKGHSRHVLGDRQFRFVVATYNMLIQFIDTEIGRVMSHLRALGLDQNTSVIFTADHGDEAGYRGLFDKGTHVASEEIVRVPLIIRPAPCLSVSSERPGRCSQPVELVDVYSTALELAGLDAPGGHEGKSLAPRVLGAQTRDADRVSLCEHYLIRSIVYRDWKMVYTPRREECALFDLKRDEYCFNNLYVLTECQSQRIDLKQKMIAFLMMRIHGDFTASDRQRIELALDPESGELGLCVGGLQQVTHFRAAAHIHFGNFAVLVPYYDSPILLFCPGSYQKGDEGLPYDPHQVETLLDAGLDDIFQRLPRISEFIHVPPKEVIAPTEENIKTFMMSSEEKQILNSDEKHY
ncbi:MAG: sulfatase-like hydrolase/transferase [Victivallales bacterium]